MMESTARSTEMPRALKRRKVRKGTQSCWECKRRKIRCTFVAPTEAICDGCRSRRVKCISQEFCVDDDEPVGNISSLKPRDMSLKDASPRTPLVTNITDSALLTARDTSCPGVQVKNRHDGLCLALRAAWPQQPDLDLILSVAVTTSVLFHGVVCKPYSAFLNKSMPSKQDLFRLPPPGSHPVLIARKLLQLATLLQGLPRSSVRDLGPLGTPYVKTMSCLVETAKLVTGNDDLVGSLDGIECIMIESMYENNSGNIRRAWITHRRAMVIAQMIGLHRRLSASTSLPVLDAKTRARIDAHHMWFRLVITDRYLSLILGLPQCSVEDPFGSPQSLEGCTALERMEHLESVAGGLILQRNTADLHNLEKTEEIDKMLQDAAVLMPPQWWLIPNAEDIVGNDSEALLEMLRVTYQFTHYHLVAQVHLPYLLQASSDDRRYDYSKITAVTASREILTRFVVFRRSNAVTAYCKGIDFLAFIASTVLSLAHIDACQQQQSGRSGRNSVLGFLAHQRPSDRGLLERTVQCMDEISHDSGGKDVMAGKISRVLQHLLTIEKAAANGASYTMTISSEPSEPGEPGKPNPRNSGATTDADDMLHIHIPYFGTVQIEQCATIGASRALLDTTRPSRPGQPSQVQNNYLSHGEDPRSEPPTPTNINSYPIGSMSVNTGWQTIPSHPHTLDSTTVEENVFHFDDSTLDTSCMLIPGLGADADHWALQGVDMALFDSLIRGAAEPSADGSPGHRESESIAAQSAGSKDTNAIFDDWI
ncbi:hypothetical protein CONLIGDRAFT_13887 [Coniochaeta ligniaria NRRL 30616]|uniref:Zn(2)-C6 fungal-type domain-containing protein n=1 Tax=Coniochaeta ligniaria NRRL 30616 TaxID=1408157 RepID=A0A1J7JYW7_9PEZI|nr:hypothetical protein CONLIGDRAFT_13887 [Coniochaeta ligniaria NRRL 30616]